MLGKIRISSQTELARKVYPQISKPISIKFRSFQSKKLKLSVIPKH